MLLEERIKKVCEGILPFYRHANLDDLLKIAQKAKGEAEARYKTLSNPITCDLSTYTLHWVSEAILSDVDLNFASRTKLDEQNENFKTASTSHIGAIKKYFDLKLDMDDLPKLQSRLGERVLNETEDKLIQEYSALFETLEPIYVSLITALNDRAKAKGYGSQIDLGCNFYRIPEGNLQYFLDNYEGVIRYCQSQIVGIDSSHWFYSQFNNQYKHDFLSLLSSFPDITFPEGVLDFTSVEHPLINKFRSKIRIDLVNGGGSMKYLSDTDTFWIGIDKNEDHRHQVVALFHELGHVVGTLENFSNEKDTRALGLDISEYEAYTIEYELLQRLSVSVYQAAMGEVLLTFSELLFQIEAFKDPNQDLATLYARIFNYCFPKSKQTKNYTYLIKYNMVYRPFRHLPHAIALTKILSVEARENIK